MKIGIIVFHKNIIDIYSKEWVDKCLDSLKNQTYKDLYFYEINYGGDEYRLIYDSKFYNIPKKNYAEAMNFIISEAFSDGCDFIFNTNLDDYYREDRIEKQLYYLNLGYDIVSSDFCYINESNQFIENMIMSRFHDIKRNLKFNHNVISHPSVGMSRNFWSDNKNRYDVDKVPTEDLFLWKESIERDYKFYIVNEILLYYRIHNKQVSKK
jgi:hypothetical protein